MSVYNPPTIFSTIYNPSYFITSTNGLTQAQANGLYLQKTVADTATEYITFTTGTKASNYDVGSAGSALLIGASQTSLFTAIGCANNRTGNVTLASGATQSANVNLCTGDTNSGAVNISTGATNSGLVNICTGATNTGSVHICDATANTGQVHIANHPNNGGAVNIANGTNNTGVVHIADGNNNTAEVHIANGNSNTGNIRIGDANASTTGISIGSSGMPTTINGTLATTGLITANGGLSMGTGKPITLQSTTGYVAPTSGQLGYVLESFLTANTPTATSGSGIDVLTITSFPIGVWQCSYSIRIGSTGTAPNNTNTVTITQAYMSLATTVPALLSVNALNMCTATQVVTDTPGSANIAISGSAIIINTSTSTQTLRLIFTGTYTGTGTLTFYGSATGTQTFMRAVRIA